MKTKIQNIGDVEEFFTHLLDLESLNFHPDNDFKDYICREGANANSPSYTQEEAELRNDMLAQCFEVCERAGVDIYDIGFQLLYERLTEVLNID